MSIEENKAIVRRYQEIYNQNNLDGLTEVVAENFLTPRMMPGMPQGLEGARKIHELTLLGMPDWQTKIEELIAEGNKVVARVTMTGTHSGDFFGIPATGKQIKFSGIYIVQIESGKIVEHWGEEDSVGLLQQLGAMAA